MSHVRRHRETGAGRGQRPLPSLVRASFVSKRFLTPYIGQQLPKDSLVLADRRQIVENSLLRLPQLPGDKLSVIGVTLPANGQVYVFATAYRRVFVILFRTPFMLRRENALDRLPGLAYSPASLMNETNAEGEKKPIPSSSFFAQRGRECLPAHTWTSPASGARY